MFGPTNFFIYFYLFIYLFIFLGGGRGGRSFIKLTQSSPMFNFFHDIVATVIVGTLAALYL